MSQKVIQFPGTGARTAAGGRSEIVLRIGPRRYRLDIARPATGRGSPKMKFVHYPLRRAAEVFPLAMATTPAVPTVTAALRP